MEIFISWSGKRSKAIAEAFRNWLPKVLRSVNPWVSTFDISQGARWNEDIAKGLEVAKAGIICLTPFNLTKESILFEAGAISKSVKDSRVYTVLSGLDPTDLSWPLAQFQATRLTSDALRKMVKDINNAIIEAGETAIQADAVDETFDVWWPKLEKALSALPTDESQQKSRRSDRELLEEILELLRAQERYRTQDLASIWAPAAERSKSPFGDEVLFTRSELLPKGVDREASTISEIRSRISAELNKQGHNTAAVLLDAGEWNRTGDGIEVKVGIKKTMLGLTLNREAIAIIQRVLSQLGRNINIRFIPAT